MPSTQTLARQLLAEVGYEVEHVRPRVAALVDERVVHVDLVAFGRLNGPYDASTATIVVEFVDDVHRIGASPRDQLGKIATALSAPAAIAADSNGWILFAVEADGGISALRDLTWAADPGDLREVLSPRRLLEAKLGNRQLALFPAAAVVSARGRSVRHDALAPRVDRALSKAAEVMVDSGIVREPSQAHGRAARAVIGALTTVVLRDKSSERASLRWSADVLLNRAMVTHPQQFSWLSSVPIVERDLTEELVDYFADIDFYAVEPMLLSELYESRLVDDALRRSLGTHYTPPGLAHRILAWLPVEDIEPEKRSVYDPTCGSGSLLIAAHDRLRDLQPDVLPPDRAHEQLVTMVRGADKDPVAVAIADLALFLNALPAGNGWKIEERDFFSDSLMDPAPSILVANPPWEYDNQQRQDDQAQRVLARLVEQVPLGGLLGVILPVGWLSRRSQAARESRANLFTRLDVLEVWRMPAGTFANAGMGAAVVLAKNDRRSTDSRPAVVYRRVSDRSRLASFFDNGENQCVLSWQTGPDDLARGPLQTWWRNSRRRFNTVGDYAKAVVGPQPESPARLAARGDRLPPNTAIVRWDKVSAFNEVHDAPTRPVRFPEDMQSGSKRGHEMIGRPKVIVSGFKNPEKPWRIKVAIDSVGDLLIRNGVTAILPIRGRNTAAKRNGLSEEDVLYGLFAFLGSGFVSAWLDEGTTTRYMSTVEVQSIPAPDPATLGRLAKIGRNLLAAREKTALIGDLERLVWKWSKLPENLRAIVIERLNEAEAPERRRRYPSQSSDGQIASVERSGVIRPRAGVVLTLSDQNVTLVVPGRTPTKGETVGLPPRLPGALLRPGSSLVVLDDGSSSLQRLSYVFDEVAYLSDEQIAAEFEALAQS